MLNRITRTRRDKEGQEGSVLFIVMLLILLFTGLGILAMRHARQELRSAGAYFDATQAAALVEGALAVAATDLRRSSDYYRFNFSMPDNEVGSADGGVSHETQFSIPINPELFGTVAVGNLCETPSDTSRVCVASLSGPLYSPNGAVTASHVMDNYYGLSSTDDSSATSGVHTTLRHNTPQTGPCPPGYSCFDEQNYGWYVFEIEAQAEYGGFSSATFDKKGRAFGKGSMLIGPIGAFGK